MISINIKDIPEVLLRPPHPMPYQGSKRKLASLILKLFPPNLGRLVEPFAGSAAVTLAAATTGRADAFWINDSNVALMDLWHAIIEDPTQLADGYESVWWAQHGREIDYYYEIRDSFNRAPKPELMLFLLTRAVKAAVRYNARGEFNQSPDKRRLGTRPDKMRKQIMDAHALLRGRTTATHLDYNEVIDGCLPGDLVYMDPPYQGVSTGRDDRYISGLAFTDFMASLKILNDRDAMYILSYDGRTGSKTHGVRLPSALELVHLEVNAGRSSQATLLGRDDDTFEALYLSPALATRLGRRLDEVVAHVHVSSLF